MRCVLVAVLLLVACGGSEREEPRDPGPALVEALLSPGLEPSVPLVSVPGIGVVRVGGRAPCDPSHCGVWWFDPAAARWGFVGAAPVAAEWAVWDASVGRVIAWRSQPAETWWLDPRAGFWERRATATPSPGPLEATGAAVVYADGARRTILFGGMNAAALRAWGATHKPQFLGHGLSAETWAYDAGTDAWTRLRPAVAPPARAGHALAWDPGTGRVILHGGADLDEVFDDTWAYDPGANAWTRLETATRPTPAVGASLASDRATGTLVRFGGRDAAGTPLRETWRLRGTTWTREETPEAPEAATSHGVAWCEGAQALVLYGGEREPALPDETWTYDAGRHAWTPVRGAERRPEPARPLP